MAKQRGRGVAAVNYPTGMNLGGDPTQALVHSTPTGNFIVSLSSVDLGQGIKSVVAQICAETLGVPTERVIVDTADSDTGPHCMGTFASRGTHRAGNAVIAAAKEARAVMLEVAADMLEADSRDLQTDGAGNIHIVGVPSKSVSVTDVALAAHFQQRQHFHVETFLPAQLFQYLHISRLTIPEAEIRSHMHGHGVQRLNQNLAHEFQGRKVSQFAVEGKHHQQVNAALGDQPGLSGEGREELWGVSGGKKLDGMRLESDRGGDRTSRASHFHHAVQELVVRQMDSIEVADGQHAGSRRGL